MRLLPHRTVVWRDISFTVCLFVFFCLFVFLFVRLRISQRRKNVEAWNFACVLAYYAHRSSPLLVKIGSRESRRRHKFHASHVDAYTAMRNWPPWHGQLELGRRPCLRPYGGVSLMRLASLLTHLFFNISVQYLDLVRLSFDVEPKRIRRHWIDIHSFVKNVDTESAVI